MGLSIPCSPNCRQNRRPRRARPPLELQSGPLAQTSRSAAMEHHLLSAALRTMHAERRLASAQAQRIHEAWTAMQFTAPRPWPLEMALTWCSSVKNMSLQAC